MAEVTKVTANLPREALERARRITGKGITETLVEGLEALDRQSKRQALRKLRGKIAFDLDLGADAPMILVDTSAWIEFFRGRAPVADAVDTLLDTGEAALCGPVVTELRRGLRPAERRRVLPLLGGCGWLDQPEDLWIAAGDLGAALARRGVSAKTLDLLIATHAIAHGVPVLATDSDFGAIAREGVGLSLASM